MFRPPIEGVVTSDRRLEPPPPDRHDIPIIRGDISIAAVLSQVRSVGVAWIVKHPKVETSKSQNVEM